MSRSQRSALALLLIGALLGGCSYGAEEPGLFGHSASPTPEPTRRSPSPAPHPDPVPGPPVLLPVLGEAVWTSADGRSVTVRIAVHAVRRVAGGTVLDWSVTPLSAPGLTSPAVPSFDLGLLSDGRPAIVLVDPTTGSVYRPVRLPSGRCVCSLIGPTADGWRIRETRLLQVAYPDLPTRLARVDVELATIPVVGGVPVTPQGRMPSPVTAVDLARAAQQPPPYIAGPGFDYPGGQRLTVQPEQVVAGPTATTMVWRVQSLSAGPGLADASAPPLGGADSRLTGNRVAASGPVLVAGDRRLTARLSTDGAAGRGQVSCLCSDLRSGTGGLRSANQLATLVTTYDPLPAGVRKVVVEFPGYGQRRVDVTRAAALARPASVANRRRDTWGSRFGQPPDWTPRDWPTPVPDADLLASASPRVDRLVR